MACEVNLAEAVFCSLQLSLDEQLGPQNLIDILRLMQLLTYERGMGQEKWTAELVEFLMAQM